MGRGSTSTRSKSPSAFEARKAKDKTRKIHLEKAKEDDIVANNYLAEVNGDGDGDEMTLHEEMYQGQEPFEFLADVTRAAFSLEPEQEPTGLPPAAVRVETVFYRQAGP